MLNLFSACFELWGNRGDRQKCLKMLVQSQFNQLHSSWDSKHSQVPISAGLMVGAHTDKKTRCQNKQVPSLHPQWDAKCQPHRWRPEACAHRAHTKSHRAHTKSPCAALQEPVRPLAAVSDTPGRAAPHSPKLRSHRWSQLRPCCPGSPPPFPPLFPALRQLLAFPRELEIAAPSKPRLSPLQPDIHPW